MPTSRAHAETSHLNLRLRSEDDPYVGFTDCLQRVVNEEGYKVLFRAWWLVTIPLLAMAAN